MVNVGSARSPGPSQMWFSYVNARAAIDRVSACASPPLCTRTRDRSRPVRASRNERVRSGNARPPEVSRAAEDVSRVPPPSAEVSAFLRGRILSSSSCSVAHDAHMRCTIASAPDVAAGRPAGRRITRPAIASASRS